MQPEQFLALGLLDQYVYVYAMVEGSSWRTISCAPLPYFPGKTGSGCSTRLVIINLGTHIRATRTKGDLYAVSFTKPHGQFQNLHPRAERSAVKCIVRPRLPGLLANHHACYRGGQLDPELTLHASISGNAEATWGARSKNERLLNRVALPQWPDSLVLQHCCIAKTPTRGSSLPCLCRGTTGGPIIRR